MSNLRQRAAGQEVARTDQQPPATLKSQIAEMEKQFQLAMPRGAEATQLVRDAMTAIQRTPKLLECEPKSVLGALMTCAQLGLRVGVLGHAWVLPFYDRHSRGHKAQLIIGYQGLVELAHRSDRIASLIARIVYENDEFDIAYGLEDRLDHKPFMGGDRGEPIGYYAIVKLISGGHAFIFLTKREAEEHRDAHAMARKNPGKPNEQIVGPWRDDFDAMALKTCVIKLSKWMPKSTDLARAIEVDEGIRLDTSPEHMPEETTVHYENGDTIPGTATETAQEPPQEPPQEPDGSEADPDGLGAVRAEIYAAANTVGMDAWATDEKFESVAGVKVSQGNAEQLDNFLTWLTTEAAGAAPADNGADTKGDDKGTAK